ncbi:homeobox-leucine zipper protein REVOLUTA-like isoform X2 [Citrus sinensis]|uniref:homeobox-leucine zipper protein REVOLUTA-like isoform X2 n=1 Tax=Citrus sinensis TaxID=2711 RepID=UPI00076377A2|nr:homeobox-leucine zipper protein REVOLUTA-like isoform X2 [Citrus sinensis]
MKGCLKLFDLKGILLNKKMLLNQETFIYCRYAGVDENALGACSEFVFAPIDNMFPDDGPLLPFGFCIIPLDSKTPDSQDMLTTHRTLDLTSSLEVGPATNPVAGDSSSCRNT